MHVIEVNRQTPILNLHNMLQLTLLQGTPSSKIFAYYLQRQEIS